MPPANSQAERVLKARLRTTEREKRALEQKVAELTELRGQSGVISDHFINRTSLADLRNDTWVGFVETVLGLPASRMQFGVSECRAVTVGSLLADLHTLSLSPPRSTAEAKRRHLCARMLESEAFFWVLSHPGTLWCQRCWTRLDQNKVPRCKDERGHRPCPKGYDDLRVRFMAEVAEVCYRPGVWTLFVRSPETLMLPGYGQQASSASDEDADA